ncbi:SRPBCC family protein [Nocardioides speluncae]|uniref:SRPBCC family protein n=1 Tax=Nocardioides speluncae TaxID=2670337 RepID=UPI000D68A38D|nr:SRPBCC family protein [Nocardioides speluncae]
MTDAEIDPSIDPAIERLIEESIEVAAPPERVWELVSDLPRMAEWSPTVTSMKVYGEEPIGLGTRTSNRNQDGELVWQTHAEVVRFEPLTEIAFRVEENWVVWSFTLVPSEAGTTVVQRRAAPDGISEFSLELTEAFMGGVAKYQARLRVGMRETLERIKSEAEAPPEQ